jgi:ABC-2 type transport system permease protein
MRLVHDTRLLFGYALRRSLRNPAWIVFGIVQPLLWLVLYAPLLERLAGDPDDPTMLRLFVPGVLVMQALFGTLFVGFGLVGELREGVLERLAVTPARRLAFALGRVLLDVLALTFQGLLLLGVARLMGLQASAAGVALAFVLLALLGLFAASTSYALALGIRDENALAQTLQFFVLPLLLLSGIIIPMTSAPAWIRAVAHANPFYYLVEAARHLFAGHLTSPGVLTGFAVAAALAALTLWWTTASFRKAAT